MGQKVCAQFGAKGIAPGTEELPSVYPREMGPNALAYRKEVVESGYTSGMTERFERRFAETNARSFLSTWVRWFWTEKYQERHVRRMASIIADVAERSRRVR